MRELIKQFIVIDKDDKITVEYALFNDNSEESCCRYTIEGNGNIIFSGGRELREFYYNTLSNVKFMIKHSTDVNLIRVIEIR